MALLKKISNNMTFHSLTSLIMAYLIWSTLNTTTATRTLSLPLCFYGPHANLIEEAPEEVKVTIQGPRNKLARLHHENIALHIDTTSMKAGTQLIEINENNLLLPSSLHLLKTIPASITINT